MKKLQNNYTTREQSRRLLELGVPAASADLYYPTKQSPLPKYKVYGQRVYAYSIPCWSVGRLIEIMLLCHTSDDAGIMFDKPLYEVSNCTNIEWCIRVLESSIKYGHFDFSKLEE